VYNYPVAGRASLSFGERLALIAERAPALRMAGVLNVADGECSFTLAPFEAEPPKVELSKVPDDNRDALFDPDSYPDGKVPGYNLTDNLDGEEPS